MARFSDVAFAIVAVALFAFSSPPDAHAALAFEGAQFAGGAKQQFGATREGRSVNYVYARNTSQHSMALAFPRPPDTTEPLFLHLRGRDDDASSQCQIRIRLNDAVLFEGPSAYAADKWQVKSYAIPPGSITTSNTLTIENLEPEGKAGMPPWFMVADCAIAPEGYVMTTDIKRQFHVNIPAALRDFPEPLAQGQQPGFPLRGTKGWLWKPEQYLAEIPFLPQCKMNFLMNCYGSMCDIEHVPFGNPECNRWYEPLPPAKKHAYEKVVEACKAHGITFCFSMNPNLSSKRFVNTGKPEDIDALWQHYSWMQGLGVKWFNISLDDITQGIDAVGQANVVNEILRRLREKDPKVQMIFCPTFYWGDGTDEKARPYLEILAEKLDKDVYLFWTGDAVVGPITRKGAETYKRIAGHRLFLWDNYPVNDGHPTLHLGPVLDRDPELPLVVDGYLGNPFHTQNEINRIPMFTCADYAWNPKAYDPARSIGQAIAHLETGVEERDVIRRLVEAYGGMLVWQRPQTSFNSVREQYNRLASLAHSGTVIEAYVESLSRLSADLERTFPEKYLATRKTLNNDIRWIREQQKQP